MCPNNLGKSFDPLIIKKIPRYECGKKCSKPPEKALTTPPPNGKCPFRFDTFLVLVDSTDFITHQKQFERLQGI